MEWWKSLFSWDSLKGTACLKVHTDAGFSWLWAGSTHVWLHHVQTSNDLFPFSSYVYLTWLLVYFLQIFDLVFVSWYGLARFSLSSVFLDLLVTHNAIPSEGQHIFSHLPKSWALVSSHLHLWVESPWRTLLNWVYKYFSYGPSDKSMPKAFIFSFSN